MSKESPVPRLDLAPNLRRPLSLLNPLDYLRLLYWIFFFPQASQWYVDTFGNQVRQVQTNYMQNGWICLLFRPTEFKLVVQGLVLVIAIPISISVLLKSLGIPLNWHVVMVTAFLNLLRFIFNKVETLREKGFYFDTVRVIEVSSLAPFIAFSIMSSLSLSIIAGVASSHNKHNIDIVLCTQTSAIYGITLAFINGTVTSLKQRYEYEFRKKGIGNIIKYFFKNKILNLLMEILSILSSVIVVVDDTRLFSTVFC